MIIHECIEKTEEYLDELYKDGPHFAGSTDESYQYAELSKVYAHNLEINLRILARAYEAEVQDEVYFDNHGWLKLPEFSKDRIETFESSSWKGKEGSRGDGFRFKIGEFKGKWYSGGEGIFGNGITGFSGKISFYDHFDSREEAISYEIDRVRNSISKYTECASSQKMNKDLNEIEASIKQGTLF